ncbi:uncharacterized protein LOC144581030 [Callithrix jacchus]
MAAACSTKGVGGGGRSFISCFRTRRTCSVSCGATCATLPQPLALTGHGGRGGNWNPGSRLFVHPPNRVLQLQVCTHVPVPLPRESRRSTGQHLLSTWWPALGDVEATEDTAVGKAAGAAALRSLQAQAEGQPHRWCWNRTRGHLADVHCLVCVAKPSTHLVTEVFWVDNFLWRESRGKTQFEVGFIFFKTTSRPWARRRQLKAVVDSVISSKITFNFLTAAGLGGVKLCHFSIKETR